jgi:hypothetical protein
LGLGLGLSLGLGLDGMGGMGGMGASGVDGISGNSAAVGDVKHGCGGTHCHGLAARRKRQRDGVTRPRGAPAPLLPTHERSV